MKSSDWAHTRGEIEDGFSELVELTQALVRIPTVNPPGDEYRSCAEFIERRLRAWDFEVSLVEAPGGQHPRPNAVGVRDLGGGGPVVHLNGHFDVVPPGEGWTVDPFGAEIREGRIYGRGTCDMKAGLACAMFAAEAVRRSGAVLSGRIEVSGTVDEESGGFAGVGYLVDSGLISGDSVDYAIIPEPFSPDRICVGHRGVYWSKVRALGRTAHGCMPHLGRSAISDLAALLIELESGLVPSLGGQRTAMPVVPEACRFGSLNVNGVSGGQAVGGVQTPCVADVAEAVFDRRFLVEESVDEVRREIPEVLAKLKEQDPERAFEVEELMLVPPVQAPLDSPLLLALDKAIQEAVGRPAEHVASPGTYDQKHFARGGVDHCVAYGPGRLEVAHQPDEWVALEDMKAATSVMAFTLLELLTDG
ncbi:MAG: acetylornithine deacetylase/succinyl-diaminopimelate desuccinylase family protein [Longimicrobiales bacterium]